MFINLCGSVSLSWTTDFIFCFKSEGIGPNSFIILQVCGKIQVTTSDVFRYDGYDRNGRSIGKSLICELALNFRLGSELIRKKSGFSLHTQIANLFFGLGLANLTLSR